MIDHKMQPKPDRIRNAFHGKAYFQEVFTPGADAHDTHIIRTFRTQTSSVTVISVISER